jgi:hypothetical protein
VQVYEATRIEVGPRPKLSDPDIDFDEDRHDAAVDAWIAKRDQAREQKPPESAEVPQKWQDSIDAFQTARVALTTVDPNAEDIILDVDKALEPVQTATIIHALGDRAPAIMVRIGRDPDLLDRLSDITDPIRLAIEVGKLDAQPMTRQKPAIDRSVKGRAPANGTTDRTLVRLEAEAVKTGDRTELIRYRRKLTAKAAA